jgi:hypothetical protein
MYTCVGICVLIALVQIGSVFYRESGRIQRNGDRNTLRKGENMRGSGDRGIPIGITRNLDVVIGNAWSILISLKRRAALCVVMISVWLHLNFIILILRIGDSRSVSIFTATKCVYHKSL